MGRTPVEPASGTLAARREIVRRIEALRRRLILRNVLRSLSLTLPLALGAWAVVLVCARLGVLGPAPTWSLPSLILLAAAVSVASGYLATPLREEVPLVLDKVLHARELLTLVSETTERPDHPLLQEARGRALDLLAGPGPRTALPLTRWRSWRGLPVALALVVATVLLPQRVTTATTDPEQAEQLARVGEVLEEKIAALEERNDVLDAEQLSEAVRRLEQLASELRLGETADREETLLALDSVNRLLDDYSKRSRAAVETNDEIESALEQLVANPFTEELGKALSSGDGDRLRRAVMSTAEALAAADLKDERQRQQLEQVADVLKEAARALRRRGLVDEAGVLDELARALREGDLDKAGKMMRSAEMLGACRACAGAELGREMARELAEAMNLARYLLGQGSPARLGEGCTKPGSGSARGAMPGTSSTNEENESFESGSTMVRDRQSDAVSDRRGTYDALYEPHIIEAESWVDVQVKAGAGSEGSFLTEIGRSAGTGGEATHPTRFVAAPAAGGPERAAELEHVPPGYRDLVRRYFARESAQPPSERDKDE